MVSKLQIKKYIYTSEKNSEKKYSTIVFYETGQINIFFTFKDGEKKNMKDISEHINSVGQIIKKINKFDYRIDKTFDSKIKYKIPEIMIRDKMIFMSNGLHLSSLGLNIEYVIGGGDGKYEKSVKSGKDSDLIFDYNHLEEYILQFSPYVSHHIRNMTEGDRNDNVIFIKYNRVNNFDSLFDIFQDITMRNRAGDTRAGIINFIKEKYNLVDRKAIIIFMNWKKRQLMMRTRKIQKSGDGINIRIMRSDDYPSLNKIKITNIKNFMEMIKVYYFIITVLNMYENNVNIINIKYDDELLGIDSNIDDLSNENDITSSTNKKAKYDLDINEFSEIDLDEIDLDDDNLGNANLGDDDANLGDDDANLGDDDADLGGDEGVGNSGKNILKRGKYISKSKLSDRSLLLGYDESYIRKEERLSCKDNIKTLYESDTCQDVCDDRRYTIRRLQRHDRKLFVYKGKPIRGKIKK